MTPTDSVEFVDLPAIGRACAAGAVPDGWSYAPLRVARDFEAAWAVIAATADGGAAISEARATHGATLRGQVLPRAAWSDEDPVALSTGTGDDRVSRLAPAWRPLVDGDALTARWPAATWWFVRGS